GKAVRSRWLSILEIRVAPLRRRGGEAELWRRRPLVAGAERGAQCKARFVERLGWAHAAHRIVEVAADRQYVRISAGGGFDGFDRSTQRRAARDNIVDQMQRARLFGREKTGVVDDVEQDLLWQRITDDCQSQQRKEPMGDFRQSQCCTFLGEG